FHDSMNPFRSLATIASSDESTIAAIRERAATESSIARRAALAARANRIRVTTVSAYTPSAARSPGSPAPQPQRGVTKKNQAHVTASPTPSAVGAIPQYHAIATSTGK